MSPVCSAQVRSKRKELKAVQKELESTRREIEEYEELEKSLTSELSKIESRSGETRKQVAALQRRVKDSRDRRYRLKGRLAAMGQASGLWKSAMDSDLQLYAQALAGRENFFGSPEFWRLSFQREAILGKARFLVNLKGASRSTATAEAETRRRAEELMAKTQRARAEEQRHREQYARAKTAQAQAQEKAAAARRRAAELEESAKALTKLIAALGRPRPGRPAVEPKWSYPRHSFPWPALGSVVQPFGRQRNEELKSWVIHQGIRLKTQPDAVISAVESGQVIFTGLFRSYGQVLIVDHGSNFFSIYGELSETFKSKGAKVAAGEAVAKAGKARDGKSGVLYLELRNGTAALDPLIWLRKL
ncbi:MAG: peptidoglycan DD-metalloendopeptidase family protein [Elusimicrobia bacterium]|nr:peptidoglycan DD-metalloendopeptidase family protein [Elusimicrobiota bacterium]